MIPRWIASSVWSALVLGLGACFTAPSPPVHFSCDPENAPTCPEGYACLSDGCCHRKEDGDGPSGACRLGEGADTGSGSDEGEPEGSGDSG